MSTLGDPLTDLGALLAFWSEAGDDDVLTAARIVAPVTAAEGFPSRAEVIERYARATGFDVSDAAWYQAFAFFKLAVVCQGIAARAAGGAMVGSGFDDAQRLVAPLVDAGRSSPRLNAENGRRVRAAPAATRHLAVLPDRIALLEEGLHALLGVQRTGARRCRSCSRARSASRCRRRGRGWPRAW